VQGATTSDATARAGLLERTWVFWALLAAATAVGALLRLHGLDKPSLWVDEFFTIARAGNEPTHWSRAAGYLPTRFSLWLAGADLAHIDLANVVQWPALGVSERAARLGPCWIGIASVPILGVLARGVVGPGVAALAALLVAITPWHLYWSQMARYYSAQFLLVQLFLLLFARGVASGRNLPFALSAAAALLAYLCHPTALFVVGACGAVVATAWWFGAPLPHLRTGLVWLVLTAGGCALVLALRELGAGEAKLPLAAFAEQSWDASLDTLALGTVLRIEPTTFAAGLAGLWIALRRRDAFGLLIGAVAICVPVGVLALKPLFPIDPRYYFNCFFAWALLASLWCVEVDRRVSPAAGAIAGAAGAALLVVAVGFSAFLYTRDGSGARERWRDAFAYVRAHAAPEAPVYVQAGDFQAQYYLGRAGLPFPKPEELGGLVPGSWLVHRNRGAAKPVYGDRLEVLARYEVPSKPWSWVVYVMRVPAQ
jgi:hypothetical protein